MNVTSDQQTDTQDQPQGQTCEHALETQPKRTWPVRLALAVLRIPDWLLIGWLMIGLVRLYQIFLSPIFGRQCRFQPTCSHYFIGAVKKDGAVIGAIRGAYRILRCNPWCTGGWDPP